MSLVFRLAGRQVGSQFLNSNRSGLLAFVRPVTIKAKPAQAPIEESHDERNMRLKRPQSPHLTIYAPQLTSMLSITHRATGMVLSAYVVAFSLGALGLPDTIPSYIEDLECLELGSTIISVIKFCLALPLTYHFWNGIRHLIWDMGKCLSLREVYITGYVMLLLAYGSAAALSLI